MISSVIYPKISIHKQNFTDIPEDACNSQNVKKILELNELIVDATTTLEFPRDLAINSEVKRAASIFLTPSGNDSVVLMEDSKRSIRLDALEAQYYRAILLNDWGQHHLANNYGHLVVGGGCRDISVILPIELINLHAAIIARQIRLRSEYADAFINVWHSNTETGAVVADSIIPAPLLTIKLPPWNSCLG